MSDKIKVAGNKAEELMIAVFHAQVIVSLRDVNISRKAESRKALADCPYKSRNSERRPLSGSFECFAYREKARAGDKIRL